MFEPLHKLTSDSLRDLSTVIAASGSTGISHREIQQVVGHSAASDVSALMDRLVAEGWNPIHLAQTIRAIADASTQAANPESLFDLVLSGPEVPGVPTRDTAAVMHTLFEKAEREVILVGYAIHNGKKLFQRLAERMAENPNLKVWFCLHIFRKPGDTSLNSEIVARFAREFATKHWPWEPRPEVYYDPRCLSQDPSLRTSMHAKCVVVDRKTALITSANFTEAARERNIEAGIVIHYEPIVCRLAEYISALKNKELCYLSTE